jgi:hypothetical protein
MSASRALPPRPSLEFEHKEAKALLRRLRAGDAEAVERVRARHPAFDPSIAARAKLADAQLTIAREYGFASWPRLVRWFEGAERPRIGRGYFTHDRKAYEGTVRSLMAPPRERSQLATRTLATYVPRFYGARSEDLSCFDVSEDEARLAVARSEGFTSWEVLLEHIEADRRLRALQENDPVRAASAAMRTGDLDALRRVVDAHPALMHPSAHDEMRGRNLLSLAVNFEIWKDRAILQPIVDWLVAQGFDLQLVLNRKLCGYMGMEPERVRWLLDRGADPNWIAPSGIPVLEHALLRYWNGEAVDVIAARATPREALWIAAGLGDVDGVRRALDRRGRPTAAARRLRPDFEGVGAQPLPAPPVADDEERLLEAFLVAMLNGRTEVLEYMASRGTPANSLAYDTPLVSLAVGNGWPDVVESLIRCGADLDLRGWRSNSPRELARSMFEQMPDDANRRRIAELCGMDPDVVLGERNARPVEAPEMHPMVPLALELAADDAARLGQTDVRPENLLMGLARCGELPLSFLADSFPMDIGRFRADMGDRVRASDDRVPHGDLPMRADAQAAIDSMIVHAAEQRRTYVTPHNLLHALVRAEESPVADLLTRYGTDVGRLRSQLATA